MPYNSLPKGSFNSVGGCGQFLLRNEINYPDTSSRHDGFDCLPRPSYKIDHMIQWFQLPSTSVIGKVIKIRCVRGLSRFTENREMRLPSWHRLKPGVPRGKNATSGYCLGPSLLSVTQDLCDKGHQNGGHEHADVCQVSTGNDRKGDTLVTSNSSIALQFYDKHLLLLLLGEGHLLTPKALVWILSSINLRAFFIML